MNSAPEVQSLAPGNSIAEILHRIHEAVPDKYVASWDGNTLWLLRHDGECFPLCSNPPTLPSEKRQNERLQIAVQDWVEKRGWYWEVTYRYQCEYAAIVWVAVDDGLEPENYSHPTAVGALLGAFSNALQLYAEEG